MSRVVTTAIRGTRFGRHSARARRTRNVVFQWRSWTTIPSPAMGELDAAVISAFHVNCFFQDKDGHFIISTPDWVKRSTPRRGEIMWHLGAAENQFTFVGVTPATRANHFRSHMINRLPNGNVLLYNNAAFQPGATSSPMNTRSMRRTKLATHIWTYSAQSRRSRPFQGDAQRLSKATRLSAGAASAT